MDVALAHWSASWPVLIADVGMLFPLMAAGVSLLMQWFSKEESAELAAGPDRLLASRRHDWPSRPVHR